MIDIWAHKEWIINKHVNVKMSLYQCLHLLPMLPNNKIEWF